MKYSRIVAVAGVMLMAACAQNQPGFDGSYRLAGIDGQKVPASATLTIAGNQISGQGPCNAYNAQNQAAWPAVALSPIASTRRALAPRRLAHGSVILPVPITAISQVLRHRDLATTALYAKVDTEALRTVARPWPGTAR